MGNIGRITKGYNVLIGNLLELPDIDKKGHEGEHGQHQPIFSAFSVLESEARNEANCQILGYTLAHTKICSGEIRTQIYSNGEEIRQLIGDKVKTGTNVEEFTFSVSEGENFQFSQSTTFGESLTSTQNEDTNHCIDEGQDQSLEE